MAELRVKGTGTIKLFENDNTSNVTIASPASLGADRTITLPDASVTLASGTMLATDGDGSSLTGLTAGQIPNLAASKITSGTMATARLGSGTASSSTVLYGDQTYKTEPGGQILATAFGTFNTETSTTATSYGTGVTGATATLTTVNDNAKILCLSMVAWMHANSDSGMMTLLYSVDSAADALAFTGTQTGNGSDANMGIRWGFDYSPATECYINQETHSSTAGETIAYKQAFWCYPSSAQTLYINRAAVAPSAYKAAAAICSIQLFELA